MAGLVRIKDMNDNEKIIAEIYSQGGDELQETILGFLFGKRIVNGFSLEDEKSGMAFNGAGDFAVRFICFLKELQNDDRICLNKQLKISEYQTKPSMQIGTYYLINTDGMGIDELYEKYGIDVLYEVEIGYDYGVRVLEKTKGNVKILIDKKPDLEEIR
jgi:hypothetical protein